MEYEYLYRNDGLVIGWNIVKERSAIHVELWQVMIDGKKPIAINGARDDLIDVVYK